MLLKQVQQQQQQQQKQQKHSQLNSTQFLYLFFFIDRLSISNLKLNKLGKEMS
jgi:hypothetical protein